MTSSIAPAASASAQPAGMPGEIVRTVVNFLLFLHFFALGVAVFSNWSPSPLARGLRKTPGVLPYLQALDMDLSYIGLYNLHDGMPEDTDAFVELDLKFKDGSDEHLVYPDSKLWPRERRRHFARLAEVAGDLSAGQEANQDLQSIVPQAIAAHAIAEAQARGKKFRSGTIRIRRLLLQPMEAIESSLPAERDPYSDTYFRKLYEARIVFAGGKVQLLKVEEARDVAPAAASAGKAGK